MRIDSGGRISTLRLDSSLLGWEHQVHRVGTYGSGMALFPNDRAGGPLCRLPGRQVCSPLKGVGDNAQGFEPAKAPRAADSGLRMAVHSLAMPSPPAARSAETLLAAKCRKLARLHCGALPALFTRLTGLKCSFAWAPALSRPWSALDLPAHSDCAGVSGRGTRRRTRAATLAPRATWRQRSIRETAATSSSVRVAFAISGWQSACSGALWVLHSSKKLTGLPPTAWRGLLRMPRAS